MKTLISVLAILAISACGRQTPSITPPPQKCQGAFTFDSAPEWGGDGLSHQVSYTFQAPPPESNDAATVTCTSDVKVVCYPESPGTFIFVSATNPNIGEPFAFNPNSCEVGR